MSGERVGNGMEFKYRAVDAQAAASPQPPPPSPPLLSSGCSYFTEQAIRAGYMAPGTGRIQENIRSPPTVWEAIERELEKQRIREDIILSEIARRRVLEAEVRREMMLERELEMQKRECNVFNRYSFTPRAGMRFESSDLSFGQVEGWSLEGRIAISSAERFGNGTRNEIGGHKVLHFEERSMEPKIGVGHEMIPFHKRSIEPKIEEVKLTSEASKTKEKIVFLVKPGKDLSGVKRKSLTPPKEGTSELPLSGVLKKKAKEEWTCALCKVNATSERGLNEHIQGKKHKAKEAALMAQRNGKNFGIGMRPKKTAKATMLGATINRSRSEQAEKSVVQILQSKEAGESSLQKVNEEVPPVGVIPKHEVLEAAKKNPLANKKKKFKFWCEMCHVGAYTKTVMEAHRTGKKHVMRLEEAAKNKIGPTSQMDTTETNNANEPAILWQRPVKFRLARVKRETHPPLLL